MSNINPIDYNPKNYNPQDDDTENFTSDQIQSRMIHAWEVIRPYSAMLDCEIVQFFNRNYWNLIPPDWQEYLMKLNVVELANFMDVDNTIESVHHEDKCVKGHKNDKNLPYSLQSVRHDVKLLSLSRKHRKYHRMTRIHPGNKQEFEDFTTAYEKETKEFPFYENLMTFDKKKPPLSFLRYKCKDKKMAEIVIMGDLCFKASLLRKIDFLVDIGAGLGHLSRCLAYFYGINVITIEMDRKMTEEARRLDEKFLKLIKHRADKDPNFSHQIKAKILRLTHKITPSITSQDFLNLLTNANQQENEFFGDLTSKNFKFGLVGLHPCGNLAPTMLNLYKSCKNCQFINTASCCYNKMSILNDPYNPDPDFIGFPLNNHREMFKIFEQNNQNQEFLQQSQGTADCEWRMGRNQLGLALHALESHQERFIHEKDSFKADFYRALVEKFIEEIAPEFREKRRKNVRTIGGGAVQKFREYIKLSIPDIFSADNKYDDRIEEALKEVDEDIEFHKILAFSALRHMFAPLLESIVLLDRLLYLKQDSSYCHVTQRFDPKISPRVHVITAFKDDLRNKDIF